MLSANMAYVKCVVLLAMGLLTVYVGAQPVTTQSESQQAVWTWSSQCAGDHKLGVTVRLENKVLYRGVLSICQDNGNKESGHIEFHFVGGHSFQGEYRTRPTDLIEGDVWRAGGESNALILGISFDNKKQVLLNTLHIANPGKRTSTEVDKGLFITTYPAS
jgi:hypothetical protein